MNELIERKKLGNIETVNTGDYTVPRWVVLLKKHWNSSMIKLIDFIIDCLKSSYISSKFNSHTV